MNTIIQLLITNKRIITWLIAALLSAVAAVTLEPLNVLHDALHQVEDVPAHKL